MADYSAFIRRAKRRRAFHWLVCVGLLVWLFMVWKYLSAAAAWTWLLYAPVLFYDDYANRRLRCPRCGHQFFADWGKAVEGFFDGDGPSWGHWRKSECKGCFLDLDQPPKP